jgi:hypothetical protein
VGMGEAQVQGIIGVISIDGKSGVIDHLIPLTTLSCLGKVNVLEVIFVVVKLVNYSLSSVSFLFHFLRSDSPVSTTLWAL